MNSYKKYFEFKGTIDGSDYFLRNLLAGFVAFTGGYLIGLGIGTGEPILKFLGFILVLPAIYFNACTIYKRISAVIGENAGFLTGLVFLGNLLPTMIGNQHPVSVFSKLILLIFGLFLIFKNSNIENHEG